MYLNGFVLVDSALMSCKVLVLDAQRLLPGCPLLGSLISSCLCSCRGLCCRLNDVCRNCPMGYMHALIL